MGVRRRLDILLQKTGMKRKPMTKEEQWKAGGATIGKNFAAPDSVLDYCYRHLITIGDNVTISGTTILAHDASTKRELGYSKVGNVTIGDNVFIGYGCIILPNVRIGNKVIIGAGTVVSKDVPDNAVIVGNPYRYLCTYDEYMEKNHKRFQELPVFDVLFTEKTHEQQVEERLALRDTGGFDL